LFERAQIALPGGPNRNRAQRMLLSHESKLTGL
jgi:hypothetical protein